MRRSRPNAASAPCPVCDAQVPVVRAAEGTFPCPACGAPLLPARTAGLGRRVAAALVDAGAIAVVAIPVQWFLSRLVHPPPLLGPVRGPLGLLLEVAALPPGAALVRVLPVLILTYLYLALYWAAMGQTPGGRLLRIRVADGHGRAPGPVRTTVRALAHLLGAAPGLLGWIFAAFEIERRTLHDKVSGTWVIRCGDAR